MKISVVIPAYNHEKYIVETIKSVLSQTFCDFELIIVNDGSTDRTEELVLSFDDKRINYLHQNNQGAHAAINKGIGVSSGEYVAILNSDDVYTKNRLQKCLDFLETNTEFSTVITKMSGINDNSLPVSPKDSAHIKAWMNWYNEALILFTGDKFMPNVFSKNILVTTSNYFFRKATFEKTGGFRPLRYAHDWDMLIKLSGKSKIHLLDDVLLRYRIHNANTVQEKNSEARVKFEVNWLIADNFKYLLGDENNFHEVLNLLKCNHYISMEVLAFLLAYGKSNNYADLLNFNNPATKELIGLL